MDKTAKTKAVARHKAKTVKYPTKTSINMMTCGLPQHTGRTLGIGVCLIALLVAFVVKVGVYDQLARLDRAESAYQTVHQQNLTLQERVADYEASVGVYVPKNSDRLFSQSELRYYSAAIFFLATECPFALFQ